MKNRLSALLILCIPFFLLPVSPDDYSQNAHLWAHKVSSRVKDPYLLETLLALVHHSYARSYMTLKAQYEYLDFFEQIGQGWHHIVNTRMDPSKSDFDVSRMSQEKDPLRYRELLKELDQAQQQYRDILEEAVGDQQKKFTLLKPFVDELRSEARTVVASTLITTLKEVEEEIRRAHQELCDAAALFKGEKIDLEHKALTDMLWHFVPSVMVKAFVNFDNGCTASSKGCFKAYTESQRVANDLWRTIEVPRAYYYAAYYQALYEILMRPGSPTFLERFPAPEVLINQVSPYAY